MGVNVSSLVDTLPYSQKVSGREREFEGVGIESSREDLIRHSLNDSGILPIAKSTFRVFDWVLPDIGVSGWKLPGHGRSYGDCGVFWKKGCLDVEAHNQSRIDDVDVVGKIYVKVLRRSCNRASCPICYEKWAGKEAHKIEYRLSQWRGNGKVIHLVVSPPKRLWYMSPEKLRRKSYLIAKKVRFLGGSCIFHPFREACLICGGKKGFKTKRCQDCGSFQFGWYFSPHFHMLGFGWIRGTAENYKKTGWVVVNEGIRKSVGSTALYQLSHCGVHDRFHSVTWFGRLSYNKLRVVPEVVEEDKCPLCGAELVRLMWGGVGDPPISDLEGDYFVDPQGWVNRGGWWGGG